MSLAVMELGSGLGFQVSSWQWRAAKVGQVCNLSRARGDTGPRQRSVNESSWPHLEIVALADAHRGEAESTVLLGAPRETRRTRGLAWTEVPRKDVAASGVHGWVFDIGLVP